jgi:glycosyltransferase involved in cell wall biosynthesis
VGRIWDAAKNVQILLETPQNERVCIVGWEQEPGREGKDVLLSGRENVELLGPKSQLELLDLYSRAAIYAATSRYEPFGLSPLEAAFSRCALVMNDNPVFHELWGDAAIYFRKDDPDDLARVLNSLQASPGLRQQYGARAYDTACTKFTASRMVQQYQEIYQDVCSPARVA